MADNRGPARPAARRDEAVTLPFAIEAVGLALVMAAAAIAQLTALFG